MRLIAAYCGLLRRYNKPGSTRVGLGIDRRRCAQKNTGPVLQLVAAFCGLLQIIAAYCGLLRCGNKEARFEASSMQHALGRAQRGKDDNIIITDIRIIL